MAGAAGYDWCLIDGEHGPNDLPLMVAQLRALEGRGASAVVRVPQGEDWILKQVLGGAARGGLCPGAGQWLQCHSRLRQNSQ